MQTKRPKKTKVGAKKKEVEMDVCTTRGAGTVWNQRLRTQPKQNGITIDQIPLDPLDSDEDDSYCPDDESSEASESDGDNDASSVDDDCEDGGDQSMPPERKRPRVARP